MNKPMQIIRVSLSVLTVIFLTLINGINAMAHEHGGNKAQAQATYLANEAVLVTNGNTKIMFDPLFGESYGTYPLVPKNMREKIMKGEAPFDGIDGVFVSHVHGDHFAADDMISYMTTHKEVRLFAPEQAIESMKSLQPADMSIFDRVVVFKMDAGAAPINITSDDISVDAVRIPHSGNRANIENMVFRVTLGAKNADHITVMHMGDAGTRDSYFAQHKNHWAAKQTDHAFPPYWFVDSKTGRDILQKYIKAKAVTGVHVPVKVPLSLQFGTQDYFSIPGETRQIPYAKKERDHE